MAAPRGAPRDPERPGPAIFSPGLPAVLEWFIQGTMFDTTKDEVTRLLQAIGNGQVGANAELLDRLYGVLRGIAVSEVGARRDGTLQPTALVHEAYLRLLHRESSWESRGHFFFAAARAMRDVLVEQARRRISLKRGGAWKREELEDLTLLIEPPDIDILALDEALDELARTYPRQHQLVQLRFFAGLDSEETAKVLGISRRTAERDWRFVRARLHLQLESE